MDDEPYNNSSILIEIYKMYVDSSQKISEMRQKSNNYYLTLNTVLFTMSAFFDPENGQLILCLLGISICVLWRRAIQSYKSLNSAKFQIIHEMELSFEIKPYTNEWNILEPADKSNNHRKFSDVEIWIPILFAIAYVAISGAQIAAYI